MPKDKTERIFIRVSPTEKKEIEEKARLAHKSVANYLISLSKNKRVVDTSKLPPLILEIRRIGVNINQIAAVANSQKYVNKEMLARIDDNQKETILIVANGGGGATSKANGKANDGEKLGTDNGYVSGLQETETKTNERSGDGLAKISLYN